MKHSEKPAVEPEPSWEEFRRYSRRDIDVRIKIALNNNGVQTFVYGRGNDIAEGGMAAYISMEMAIGSRIKMELQLPYSQQPLKIAATVRNRYGFRYGLEFTVMSDKDREIIRRACHALSLVQ
jgi:c-di-GMP-binding flagellar brake protein YcgR